MGTTTGTTTGTTMASARSVGRRIPTALALAFGLVLMHGGIGQAMACTAMPATMSTTPAMPTGASHDHHHNDQPADAPPRGHGATVCVSTPAGSAGGVTAPAPLVAVVADVGRHLQQRWLRVTGPGGREPPAPDPVSDLCVSRS